MGRSRISQKQTLQHKTFRLTALDAQSVLSLVSYSSGRKRRFLIATVIAASGVVPIPSHYSVSHPSVRNSNAQMVATTPSKQSQTPSSSSIGRRRHTLQRIIRSRLSRTTSLLARIRLALATHRTPLAPLSHYGSASQTVRGSP